MATGYACGCCTINSYWKGNTDSDLAPTLRVDAENDAGKRRVLDSKASAPNGSPDEVIWRIA